MYHVTCMLHACYMHVTCMNSHLCWSIDHESFGNLQEKVWINQLKILSTEWSTLSQQQDNNNNMSHQNNNMSHQNNNM